MNLSRLVSEIGPSVLQSQIQSIEKEGGDASFLREHGTRILNGLSDHLLDQEVTREDSGRARFIAHLAADLLRGWPGEPSLHYQEAVRIAVEIIKLADKAASDRT